MPKPPHEGANLCVEVKMADIRCREGYGYVWIDRTNLYPRTRIMTPDEDPDERRDGLEEFLAPFDGKLVRLRVEIVSPED